MSMRSIDVLSLLYSSSVHRRSIIIRGWWHEWTKAYSKGRHCGISRVDRVVLWQGGGIYPRVILSVCSLRHNEARLLGLPCRHLSRDVAGMQRVRMRWLQKVPGWAQYQWTVRPAHLSSAFLLLLFRHHRSPLLPCLFDRSSHRLIMKLIFRCWIVFGREPERENGPWNWSWDCIRYFSANHSS